MPFEIETSLDDNNVEHAHIKQTKTTWLIVSMMGHDEGNFVEDFVRKDWEEVTEVLQLK